LLDFFIPHFIGIAKTSHSFRAIRQARFYLQHAERLVKLLRERGDAEAKVWKYSSEIKALREGMDREPSTALPKLDASSGGLHYVKSNKTKPTASEGAKLKNVNTFREKMELPNDTVQSILKKPAIMNVPLPSVEKCDEQSGSQAATTTIVQVHEHSAPSSPKITTDVIDSCPKSEIFVLNEVVTAESTDF
jgi:hypothetical protein